jgi:aminoglycoside phosphotransferase (APT) family kinase protein
MQDVGQTKVGIPTEEDMTPPSAETDQAVGRGLASIHARHVGQQQELGWLPRADAAYITDFLVRDVWRGNWEDACRANPAFATEFAPYAPALERAAEKLARTVQALWDEGDSLTLTHGEVHGEHVMLSQGRPYFIDWGWTYYGPFYLDLPAYFTPHTVHHYHRALVERGIEISKTDFMERYHAIGRYVGFKYLCSGLWIWPPGPTAVTGRRILMTIKWAIDGTWPERAFAVPATIWQRLLAEHVVH